jgi:hypothetical protein
MVLGNNNASLTRKSNGSVSKQSAMPTARKGNALNGEPSDQDVMTTATNETLRSIHQAVVDTFADELDLATRLYKHLEREQSKSPPTTANQWYSCYWIPCKGQTARLGATKYIDAATQQLALILAQAFASTVHFTSSLPTLSSARVNSDG